MIKNKYLENVLRFSFLFSLFPLFVDFQNVLPTFVFFVLLVVSGISGKLLFGYFFNEGDELDSLLFIILGFFFFSIISLLTATLGYVLMALLTGYQLIKLVKPINKKQSSSHSATGMFDFLLLSLIAFGYLFIGDDFWQAKHLYVTEYNDAFYFSALTESLKQTGYWNAFFDLNAPINYQFASLVIPAAIEKITGVTSNQALYLYSMPFYKLAGILAFALAVQKLLQARQVPLRCPLLLAGLLLFTLTSLNPINIVKLKPEGFVFLSFGNFLPGGNPGITFAFVLISYFLLIVLKGERSLDHWVVLTLLLVLILLSKIALWLPALIFFVVFEGIHFAKERKGFRFLFLAMCSFIFSFLMYYIFFTSFTNSKIVIDPFNELGEFMERSLKMRSADLMRQFFTFFAIIALAFGIRLVVIGVALFSKVKDFFFISFASLVSLFSCSIFLLLLKIYCVDQLGNIIVDDSFNLEQFIRSAFILVMFNSVFFTIYFLNTLKGITYKIFVASFGLYCLLALTGVLSYSMKYGLNFQEGNNSWREEIRTSLAGEVVKGSFCMIGNSVQHNSYFLCADGIGPWWYSGRRGDGSLGYYQSNKNSYRAAYVDSIAYGRNPVSALAFLKSEGVKYIITTPNSRARIDSIAVSSGLKVRAGSNLIFEFE